MSFPALKEAEGQLAAKQAELRTIFDEAGPDLDMSKVKSVDGDSAAIVEHIRALNAELDDLGKKADGLREVAKAADRARRIPEQREPGDATDTKGKHEAEAAVCHVSDTQAGKVTSTYDSAIFAGHMPTLPHACTATLKLRTNG